MNSSKTPLLEAHGLCFSYNGHNAVDKVSLTLTAGQFLGIAGPNGSGKSTLLRLLAGRLKPGKGRVLLRGRELNLVPAHSRAAEIAVLPPEPESTYGFSVLETVLMGKMLALPWWRDADGKALQSAEEALELVGLESVARRALTSLSSGERQRVFLAQALCGGPKVLLLDEPTSHLDLRHWLETMLLLKKLADKGLAVAAVLHDINSVAEYCSHALLLKDGRTSASGTTRQALTPETLRSVYGIEARQNGSGWRFALSDASPH
ncbi:MAG TPA: ABC transporter ATP-binding protein [Elusimicrobiales bacterium]|nr:ABC transporter ATP-binding protein [Elusimicrobiales bacterium]